MGERECVFIQLTVVSWEVNGCHCQARLTVVARFEVQSSSGRWDGGNNGHTSGLGEIIVAGCEDIFGDDGRQGEFISNFEQFVDVDCWRATSCCEQVGKETFGRVAGKHFPEWTIGVVEDLQRHSLFRNWWYFDHSDSLIYGVGHSIVAPPCCTSTRCGHFSKLDSWVLWSWCGDTKGRGREHNIWVGWIQVEVAGVGESCQFSLRYWSRITSSVATCRAVRHLHLEQRKVEFVCRDAAGGTGGFELFNSGFKLVRGFQLDGGSIGS